MCLKRVDPQEDSTTSMSMEIYLEAVSSCVTGRTRAEHDAALAARIC